MIYLLDSAQRFLLILHNEAGAEVIRNKNIINSGKICQFSGEGGHRLIPRPFSTSIIHVPLKDKLCGVSTTNNISIGLGLHDFRPAVDI